MSAAVVESAVSFCVDAMRALNGTSGTLSTRVGRVVSARRSRPRLGIAPPTARRAYTRSEFVELFWVDRVALVTVIFHRLTAVTFTGCQQGRISRDVRSRSGRLSIRRDV